MIKKKFIFIIALMLIILLNGCIKSNVNNDFLTVNTSSIETAVVDGDSIVSNNVSTQEVNDYGNNGGIVYENEKLGFSIEMPQDWKENYIVDESEEDIVHVCFTGKSKVSKGFIGSTQYSNGLLMFHIGSKKVFEELGVDSSKKLGTINGVDYYFATPSDYPIGSLDLSTDQASSDLVTDENERQLMQDDFTKTQEMEKDINNIIKTFEVKK